MLLNENKLKHLIKTQILPLINENTEDFDMEDDELDSMLYDDNEGFEDDEEPNDEDAYNSGNRKLSKSDYDIDYWLDLDNPGLSLDDDQTAIYDPSNERDFSFTY